jgi:alpha-amylase
VTARLTLALAIHNHQPVGNFGWVYAEAYRQAYRPFVEALERHPAIRLSLHYTGPLIDWLRGEQPRFLERVVKVAARGQVELMGGGWDEPILVALPERDRVGQLRRMGDEVERLTGERPAGAWLAERVWEPSLPTALADAGYRWTIVDDVHFRAASIPADRAWGPYSTDDQGRRIDVFATDERLRYAIPFAAPEDVLAYLQSLASEDEDRVATMGDDGEKFGSWPRTYDHCWGSGHWVDRFFDALEGASEWLTMTTPTDWLAAHAPLGRAYIPTASYIEMTEWALPPEESVAFTAALETARAADAPEARWLRGGFWRQFQARYREINDLHTAMLRASDAVAAMPAGWLRQLATEHLYQGQSNDTYWHGVFGGVYINHLRLATWEHLIAAEDLAWHGPTASEIVDADLDGRPDVRLRADGQLVVVDLAEGAGIGEWDLRAPRHALTAVMRRRPEASHLRLLAAERAASDVEEADEAEALAEGGEEAGEDGDGSTVATIHDLALAKEEGLAAHLAYDRHERRSALVHFLHPALTAASYASADYEELGDFVDGPFDIVAMRADELRVVRDGHLGIQGGSVALRVEKGVRLGGGRLDPTLDVDVIVENTGSDSASAVLAVEFALNLLGGGGNPQAFYRVGTQRSTHDGRGSLSDATSIAFGNDWIGIDAEARVQPAAEIWWQPIETISSSEGGFERNYQGSALLFRWFLELAPGASKEVSVGIAVRCARDRLAEDRAAAEPGPTPARDAASAPPTPEAAGSASRGGR